MTAKITKWVASAALAAVFATGVHAQTDPIKVGFVLSLSGAGAVIGEDMRRGADLALKMMDGKIAGREVEFIYEDDQRKPEVGREAAEKLVNSEDVDAVIGASFSNVMMAIARPVTRSETLLLSPNPAPAPLAGAQCSRYYFATPFQNDQPSEAMGIHLNKEGLKSAFILAPNYQAGRDLLAGFKRTFEGDIVGEIYTPLDQTDFSAELTEIRSTDPEAVFVFYLGGLGVQWVRQYYQSGLIDTIPLTTAFVVGGATLPAIGDAGLDVIAAGQWAYNLPNDANREFVKAYREAYGGTPSEFAAQAYDAVRLYANAVEKVGGNVEDTDAMRAAIAAADFQSVRGDFAFNTNQHPIHDMHLLKVVEDGGEFVAAAQSVIVHDMPDSYVGECKM